MIVKFFREAVAAEAVADDLQATLDKATREGHPDLPDITTHLNRRIAEERAAAAWSYGASGCSPRN